MQFDRSSMRSDRPNAHRASVQLPAALAVTFMALATSAQAQSMTDKAVEAEIAFARGLANDWAFVDLAESVLEEVGGADLSERMSEELGLVRCDIYGIGAKASRDPRGRNELFEQALTAYEGYISGNPYASNRQQAERSLVDISSTFVRNIDIVLEDAVGEEAEALRSRKIDLLEKGVARTERLIEELTDIPNDERTAEQNTTRLVLILEKATMYGRISEATPNDAFFSEQAIETYSELIFEAGEGTEIALRANAGMGDVFASIGDNETAREFYAGMINNVIPVDPAEREENLGWSDLPQDIKAKRFLYVEIGIPGVQRTSRALGEYQIALDTGMFFYNLYRQEGFTLSKFGGEAALEVAETLVEADGFVGGDLGKGEAQWFATEEEMNSAVARRFRRSAMEFALDLSEQVARDFSGQQVGVTAGKLIAKINDRPGAVIPPAQLFQAADAERRSENYDVALTEYYKLLTALDALAPADRQEFGAKAYNGIGLALRRQDRQLEAAMAFREALTNWRDPEYDINNARGFSASIKSFARASDSSQDPEIEKLIKEAENFVIQFDTDGPVDQIQFNRAEKMRSRQDYDEAIAAYGEIANDAGYYELAQIRIGTCKLLMKDLRGARAVFDDFLTVRVADKRFDPNTPLQQNNRKTATSNAEYYRAFIDHLLANSKYKKSDGADASGFAKVIEELKDFPLNHGDSSLLLKAQGILVDSYAKTGAAEDAAAIVANMVADNKDAKETSKASLDLYQALNTRRDQLLEAGDAEANGEAIAKTTRDMAQALQVSNDVKAQYVNMRRESKLWLELDEWSEAKKVLEKLVARFQDDEKRADAVTKSITPDLVECMIELGEVNEAKALLTPLIVGEGAPLKTRRPVILLSRAMLGSITGSGSKVKQLPGAGGTPEEFEYLTGRLNSYAQSGEKWNSCQWYEAKFQSIYAYYVWGQQDDRKLATAKKLIDDVVVFLENDLQFSDVDQDCNDEEGDATYRRRFGNGVLSSRYRWLLQRTR